MSKFALINSQEGTMTKSKAVWISDTAGGNYLKQLAMIANLDFGTDANIYFSHDDWCGIWESQPCNCDPAVRVEPLEDVPG